jgi:hypothetical protein
LSTWDRLTAVSTYGPPGSKEDDEPDYGWGFYGLGNPSAMRDFVTSCDYCLSDCSDHSHNLGDEDCGPSRECFHVDLRGLDEGNHLGVPKDGDPPRPAPRVDILRELAMVPVHAGGQDAQLEQIREMQARLDEEAGQLVQLRQNVGQEWAGQAPAGEARHLPQDVQHRITDDARARLPPGFQWGQPEPGYNSNTTPSDAGTIHNRGTAYPGRTQESPGGCRGPMGRKLCLPKAWGTLRQRGGSEPLARTTRSASFQPGHTTGTVPDPVLDPGYHHQVLGGNKAGIVARRLPAGLPAGWNGR